MFKQSEISRRVLLVYKYLETNNLVSSKAEFCRRINYETPSFSAVVAGKRDYPENKIKDLAKAFNVNRNYILHGRGDMFTIAFPVKQIPVKDLQMNIVKNKVIIRYLDKQKELNVVEFVLS